MTLIVAVSDNWGIGKDNDMLFRISSDLKRFREITTGHVVIMGRKTFESLPNKKPLPNRKNIVLTRDNKIKIEDATVVSNVREALDAAKTYEGAEVFIIGGEQVYKLFLDLCTTALVTKISGNPDSDVFMPNLDEDTNWKLTEESENYTCSGLDFRYLKYERK